MKFLLRLAYIFLLFAISGCFQHATMEQPNTPHERPSYTMLSPKDYGWHFKEFDGSKHVLSFYKPQKETDHTIYGNIEEIPSLAKFDKPEDLLLFVRNNTLIDFNPKRFNILEEEVKLSKEYGDYTVSIYAHVEDHGAVMYSDNPFLIMKTYGYYFINPNDNKQVIIIYYSERGLDENLDRNFKPNAMEFINGLKIKSR